ncbi:MAG: ATPase, T2SS/T4P/T4SS family, partial [Verrucomicrobiota bacterium]
MTLLNVLQEISTDSGGVDALLSEKVLTEAAHQQSSLISALLESQLLDEEIFLKQVSERFGYEWIEPLPMEIPGPIRDLIPPRIALRFHFVPLRQSADEVVLATYDPFQMTGVQSVTSFLDRPIRWVMTTRRSLLQTLKSCYGVGADTFEELLEGRDPTDMGGDLDEEVNVVDSEDAEASVIRFVNQIIREALNQKATDIHVEPLEEDLRIRYRIDGVLHEAPVPQRIKLLQSSVISRLKIMAHLDIAEKRLPQDGRINLEFGGQPIDVRVATIPTVSGESVSLRLLGQERFDLQRLNLAPDAEENIRGLLKMSNGIILLTGPTGCGKSTTLYTFLSLLNVKERRIITIEDPVENKLEGVMQIAIKPEINLSFATALRSILRSDPNVIMVGEMRDLETA